MKSNSHNELNELKQYYLSKLPNKIAVIKNAWQEYKLDPDLEKLQLLFRQIHDMSSSASMYGYKELSDIAKRIDKILREKMHLNTENQSKINDLLAQLETKSSKMGRFNVK